MFGAALRYGAEARQLTAPALPTIRQPEYEHAHFLTAAERDRLLGSYTPAAAPVAVTLAFQGMRTQEALRMDWRRVNWQRRTLYIPESKTGRARTVPMHRRVRVTLYLIWRKRGRPLAGPVVLSSRGEPYADTRGIGGNPLAQAHATACRRAEIDGFRVHDFRHTWAAHMVMSGTDLYTLMRLGGWRSLRMVQRYAAVSIEHMAEAMGRLR